MARLQMYQCVVILHSVIIAFLCTHLQLLSLNLSNNRLQYLQIYSDLPAKCPNLRFLDLSENQLRSPAELEHIAGMKNLHTLVLENNPLSQQSQDFTSFSSQLRKLFPSLQLLVSHHYCLIIPLLPMHILPFFDSQYNSKWNKSSLLYSYRMVRSFQVL